MEMNKHVVDFCINYVNSIDDTECAILIKGKWGCGKTYIWENQIKNALLDNGIIENEIWYISMFGVKTVDDLKDRLFEVAHPIISSKAGKKMLPLAYGLAKSIIKHKTGFDVNHASDVLLNLFKDDNITCRIIVFDDIERSELSPTQFLGFTYGLLFKDKIKVIMLGDEDEYSRKFSEEKNTYEQIREKVIGNSLYVIPECEKVIAPLLMEIKSVEGFDNFTSEIVDISKRIGLLNLRVIKKSIDGMIRFYEKIDGEYSNNREYIKRLMKLYFIMMSQYLDGSMPKNNGLYEEVELLKVAAVYEVEQIGIKEYEQLLKKETEKLICGTTLEMHIDMLPAKDLWYDTIINLNETVEMINQKIKRDYSMRNKLRAYTSFESTEMYYRKYDSENYKIAVLELIKDIKSGEYLNPKTILHIINRILEFAKKDLIPLDRNEFIDEVEAEIENFKERIEGDDALFEDELWFNQLMEIKGDERFIRIKKKLDEYSETNKLKKISNDLYQKLSIEQGEKFMELLDSDPLNVYIDIAIMKVMPIDKLYSWLSSQPKPTHEKLIRFLRVRYWMNVSNNQLNVNYFSDYEPIIELRQQYKIDYDTMERPYNLRVLMYEEIIREYDRIVDYMKKKIDESKKLDAK